MKQQFVKKYHGILDLLTSFADIDCLASNNLEVMLQAKYATHKRKKLKRCSQKVSFSHSEQILDLEFESFVDITIILQFKFNKLYNFNILC